jgi:hypothetical protein
MFLETGATANGTTAIEGLKTLGDAVSYIWSCFLDMATDLFDKPIFLVGFAVFVVGAVIGLVLRVRG